MKVLALVLVIAGLASVTAALFLISVPLGLAGAGVSCFVLEWRIS